MSDGRAPPGGRQHLDEADRAERAGAPGAAAAALRRHLADRPDDGPVRLRLGRLLVLAGEPDAARRALAGLEATDAFPLVHEAERILARLDEVEGARRSAAERWERILADDIDDAEARAHLRELRPAPGHAIAGERRHQSETLVSPEGVETLRYRLVREIGRGGTAAVYLAWDEALGIDVALKVLHPQLAGRGRSEALGRFFREARLAARLRHPGVVAIYDVDETARALALEWVPGGNLRGHLRANPAGLPAALADSIVRGLLDALRFLHEHGVVHGDLKPSNLLLRAPGEVVLADFGSAVLLGGARATAGTAGGTPLYLAPEQFLGAPASPATDLYAAGAVLYEVVIGRPLRSHADLLRGGPPDAIPPDAADTIPPPWRDHILTLLDPDPSRRSSQF